jgi:hypothetical protein
LTVTLTVAVFEPLPAALATVTGLSTVARSATL